MANKVSFIDAFDREVIAHVAVTGAGISGADVRDMMLAAVERRFGADQAPHPVEHLSDNGSCRTAAETRDFARQLGLVPCLTPVRSPVRSPARPLARPSARPSARPRAMAWPRPS